MHATLLKALFVAMPVVALFVYSARLFVRSRTAWSLLLMGGSVCFVVVIFTHIAEDLRLFPEMGWGNPHSIGHYLDLSSAVGGIALLALGVLARIRTKIA